MPLTSLTRPYLKLIGDAALELLGDATQWDDVRNPSSPAGPAVSNPTVAMFRDNGAGSRGVFSQQFADPAAGTEGNDLMFNCQFSHKLKEGSVAVPSIVYPHIHWSPNDAVAGNVGWSLEYSESNPGVAFPQTQVITQAIASPAVQYMHQISGLTIGGAGLSSTTRQISAMVLSRVARTDVGNIDTYGAVVWLHEYDIHFEIDTMGSKTPLAK